MQASRLNPAINEAAGAGARKKLGRFTRVLRDNAFIVGLAETRDALKILSGPGAARPSRLRPALRALFCSRQSDWRKFDEIFDAFWLKRGMRSATRIAGAPGKSASGLQALPAADSRGGDGANPDKVERREGLDSDAAGQGKREGVSRAESLARTDFRHLTQAEVLAAAHALAARLANAMRARMTRRERARRAGRKLDLRRTIHKSIAHGGTPLELVRRHRIDKPLRLVVLLDASGSMSLYSHVFLRFMHGILDAFREAEAFVFHTRLVHISSHHAGGNRAVDRRPDGRSAPARTAAG